MISYIIYLVSHLVDYIFDDSFNFLGKYKLKEIGLEGIDIDYSGNICGVFENGIDRTRKVHLSDIVQRRSNMLDKKYYTKGV